MEITKEDFHDEKRGTKRHGRVPGATNFDDDEDAAMLKIAESVLPLGGGGWEIVSFCVGLCCDVRLLKAHYRLRSVSMPNTTTRLSIGQAKVARSVGNACAPRKRVSKSILSCISSCELTAV
jgi:hypothetical protein